MFSKEKFTCKFTTPANDVLEMTNIVYINGKIKWRTVQYPVAKVRKASEKVFLFNATLLQRENALPESHRVPVTRQELVNMGMGVELLTTDTIQLLTASGDENRDYDRIVRAVVLVILKECFEFLTPIVYYGYEITAEESQLHESSQSPPSTPELPEDVISEIYRNIGSLATTSKFELTSKEIRKKYCKPRSYEKYIALSPDVVLTEALAEHNKVEDPLVKRRLLLIIVNAIKEGALFGIHRKDIEVIFSVRDLSLLNLILTELIISLTLTFRMSTPESDAKCEELAKYILEYGRTDIVEEFVKLGIFKPFDQYEKGSDDIRRLLVSIKARFIPDNFVSFIQPLKTDEQIPEDQIFEHYPRLLFSSITNKKFDLSYHPDLLVDAINKGYIDLEHPIINNTNNLYGDISKPLREASQKDRELIQHHLEEKAHHNFSAMLKEPTASKEEYSNATDFLIFLEPEELSTMERRYPGPAKFVFPLRSGNYIIFNGCVFETVTKLPFMEYVGNGYVVRGFSTVKEICEFYENLQHIPSNWAKKAISHIMNVRNLSADMHPIDLYMFILDSCVQRAPEILRLYFNSTDEERRLSQQMMKLLDENALFEKVVFARRDKGI